MKPLCDGHTPPVEVSHQVTLYERPAERGGDPKGIWRGMVCAGCLTGVLRELKTHGATHLILVWEIR